MRLHRRSRDASQTPTAMSAVSFAVHRSTIGLIGAHERPFKSQLNTLASARPALGVMPASARRRGAQSEPLDVTNDKCLVRILVDDEPGVQRAASSSATAVPARGQRQCGGGGRYARRNMTPLLAFNGHLEEQCRIGKLATAHRSLCVTAKRIGTVTRATSRARGSRIPDDYSVYGHRLAMSTTVIGCGAGHCPTVPGYGRSAWRAQDRAGSSGNPDAILERRPASVHRLVDLDLDRAWVIGFTLCCAVSTNSADI